MGEEMAEMMSEEITKVMEEQRQIEAEYARLVQQRDQLKGITNKHRLEETKQDIMVSRLFSRRQLHFHCANLNRARMLTLISPVCAENRQRLEGQHKETVQIAPEETCS